MCSVEVQMCSVEVQVMFSFCHKVESRHLGKSDIFMGKLGN